MINLIPVSDPLNSENLEIQKTIMNSQPLFNNLVVGKESLTDEDIIEENNRNVEYGEKMFHLKKDAECVGLVTYLPQNPHDNCTWIGLLIIHNEHERNGIGTIAIELLEEKLKEHNIDKVRLCVQFGNIKGASFWNKHGFNKISSGFDNHKNQIDIYEKVLATFNYL
ncbi:GNAT family N-acetyltransferase [Paenibacillus gorillae]|uniref:GNAT family N-acetyltransferase n=1 Tax=Paenibacillus gorillae TaxID=1243662 RepID=UPI0005A5EFDF|nr:GNAT family N-acetyltransferase [Paenibacillus gorillae]